MLKEERARKAEELFTGGYNCCQAVAAAFADVTGLPTETVFRMSCPFGGGFARTQNICGAVSGMGLIAGLVYGNDDPKCKLEMYPHIRSLTSKFEDQFGSIICAELLRSKTKTCKDCVRTAAEILAEDLSTHEHL